MSEGTWLYDYYIFTYIALFIIFKYISLTMLLQLSWFSLLCSPLPSAPYFLRQSPHHCSWPWAMCTSSLAAPFYFNLTMILQLIRSLSSFPPANVIAKNHFMSRVVRPLEFKSWLCQLLGGITDFSVILSWFAKFTHL